MNIKIPNSREIRFNAKYQTRTYLRTGSCPEGRLVHESPVVNWRFTVKFGKLRNLSRRLGYEKAVQVIRAAECKKLCHGR
jgi:hypothetical protein